MRINCNTTAHLSNNQLAKAQDALDRSIQKLSSGLKINRAEDDAAGMAIANRMHTQIKALGRASKNTTDGVAVVQTAEGALNEVENMLQRVRELAVQASDGLYSDEDRAAIQAEIDQILSEVDRVSTDTEYNTMPLLDGTLSRRAYADEDGVYVQSLSSTVQSKEYEIEVTQAAYEPWAALKLTAITDRTAGVIKINGVNVGLVSGDSADDVLNKIYDACTTAGLEPEPASDRVGIKGTSTGSKEAIVIEFASKEQADALAGAGMYDVDNLLLEERGTDCKVSLGAGFDTAKASADGNIITIKDVNNFEMVVEVPDGSTLTTKIKVTDMGTLNIQSGANESQQIIIDIPKVDSHTLGIDDVNCRTTYGASRAITKLDEAINSISSIRSKLGAYQNRLEITTNSLDLFEENITSALSSIEDCDMATEMTEYTAKSVLTQAATSVLAQANERPQTVLQLLQ